MATACRSGIRTTVTAESTTSPQDKIVPYAEVPDGIRISSPYLNLILNLPKQQKDTSPTADTAT
jgi:hypothetical protein